MVGHIRHLMKLNLRFYLLSNPFQKACDILEQQTRVNIAEEELAQAEEMLEEKRNNLFNEKAKLEELENEQ